MSVVIMHKLVPNTYICMYEISVTFQLLKTHIVKYISFGLSSKPALRGSVIPYGNKFCNNVC